MSYGVGIDVSKSWLDVHVHGLGHSARFGNTPAGYGKLQAWLGGTATRTVLQRQRHLQPTLSQHLFIS